MSNTLNANPLANPKMLAAVIDAQFKTKNPSQLHLERIKGFVFRQYPEAEEASAEAALQSVADSVVLPDDQKLAILTPIKDSLKSGDFSALRSSR